ncbi:hypothetical protein SAMN05421825_3383 [Epilithonimonas hungarica]|uniref:Uncharacterized protein n=1 Tax=Epilithonimonas hungarica TaxID=454006 RepID=A0A1G7UBK0_9FLAO|nr:hypothetical protein [Epilithonimonas hungarica]SDG44748.1 hypothetical protein SAMN05421825_3383 [Epilithonimonas hungarica]
MHHKININPHIIVKNKNHFIKKRPFPNQTTLTEVSHNSWETKRLLLLSQNEGFQIKVKVVWSQNPRFLTSAKVVQVSKRLAEHL